MRIGLLLKLLNEANRTIDNSRLLALHRESQKKLWGARESQLEALASGD